MNRTNLFEQLKIDEGVKYEVYKDHLGYPTFGVGHLILKDDPEYGFEEGTPISEERVVEAFKYDSELAESECVALFGNGFMLWQPEVQEICINMMFNLGRTRLSKFKNFRAALKDKDFARAAVEGRDSLWYRQVGNRAERLMVRLEALG
jgi:GH24 family phage-related lysozyme (muramidase)|tara:strand:+ start:163 stop:609 length:447 start_codon:yes stop_codon:yes gene_type:complete